MDWQALREFAEDWQANSSACVVSTRLLDLIPADLNKKADAEWLKERGWVKSEDMHLYVANKRLGLVFEDNIGGLRLRMIGTERAYYNPTRMTVALFEAAAMEAMKHGE